MEDLLPIPCYTVYTKVGIEKRGTAIESEDATHFINVENWRTHATDTSVV
jgi:hypothetical protein